MDTIEKIKEKPTEYHELSNIIHTLRPELNEKHITIDKKMPGPDHHFALEPNELKQMVKGIYLVPTYNGI